jgi:hypothetical protein
MKAMHRMMVLSETYQRQSRPTDEAAERDPSNTLLSHMPIRRLEGESVRDAILAVSGSLDPALHGPGVTPHITEFMYPRFRPKSGPLDGAGRRSIYITVRRNFLTPMLTAFDFPNPSEPIGRREISNVPTQALTLLNNEFIHEQARLWGGRAAKLGGDDAGRITRMFETALGRAPDAEELASMSEFVRTAPDPEVCWTDLAHAIFNTKDFIFIR